MKPTPNWDGYGRGRGEKKRSGDRFIGTSGDRKTNTLTTEDAEEHRGRDRDIGDLKTLNPTPTWDGLGRGRAEEIAEIARYRRNRT